MTGPISARTLLRPYSLLGLAVVFIPALATSTVMRWLPAVWALSTLLAATVVALAILRQRRPDLTLPDPDEAATQATAELCASWRKSQQLITTSRHTARHQLALAQLRAAYLNEFERRDPDGFTRWISAEPTLDNPPEDHIRGARPQPTHRKPAPEDDRLG